MVDPERIHVVDDQRADLELLECIAEGFIPVGVAPTNCLFVGDALIVTDAGRLADSAEASSVGALWRLPLGAPGQPLIRGTLDAPPAPG